MAYKSNKDFITARINEWAAIGRLRDTDPRAFRTRADAWAKCYGEPSWSSQMWLNLYRITQGYGGPEEGGWWYDWKEGYAAIPVRTLKQALTALAILDRAAEDEFGEQRDYYSAAGGEDGRIVFETRRFASVSTEVPTYS